MFHVDSGSLHHIENIGTEPAEFIITFRHERPEDFGLAGAFGAMTDAVLALASRHRRNGLCQQGFRAHDGDGSRRHP